MSKIDVDVIGETCPKPLVETRKALNRSQPGDEVTVTGDHWSSKDEILLAVEELNQELVDVKEEGKKWQITIRKK